MKTQAWWTLAGALIALLWGGCASVNAPDRARLSLVDVRPGQMTVLESSVQLTLRVTNETDRPLSITGSSHKLSLNGTSIGSGVSNQLLTVPALSSTTLEVTVHLENLALIRKFSGMRNVPEVSYRLDSRFHGDGIRFLPLTTEGTFDVRPFMAGLQ